MTGPLLDDDLGARLRSALQQVSPLATDRAPPPRFAPTVAPDIDAASIDRDDVVELGGAPAVDRAGRRSRRRLTLAGGLLAAAAVAAGVLVATTDLGQRGGPAPTVPAAGPLPVPVETATIPDREGKYLGLTPDPVPWRCTAPAGTTIAATSDPEQFRPIVWRIGAGVTCAPFPADAGQFTFSGDGRGTSVGTLTPAYVTGGGGEFCGFAATQTFGRELSFVSRGAADYLEFAGPGCRLVLPAR